MIAIRPTERNEVKAAWERYRARNRIDRSQQPPPPRPVNVRQVLDLGSLVYFQWRGRSYGVPPLPWKAGVELLDVFLEAQNLGKQITKENAAPYSKALRRMAKTMWRHTRPVGIFKRMLKRLHLLRNPYRHATEAEIADLAIFFLGCRMKTSPDLQRTFSGMAGDLAPSGLNPTTS